eukprot:CAMPEP_0118705134 /NCGR_PEP_ID=MMETSP0800-20121206/19679_1 /TAXON_ID=210618 ORGANISM="Striatella unipunctata, Strain CCMP2910" /NCGR_SAMPLE_ID=MMETSP0800 /ASSEMBLY_ACC=CAM_ASM_000638 /LENGTH=155 /DNA_ID=CAMNT_0006607215 /DNA_START=41 /DNA_END=508 /DNA_ORIENTATION=+
MKFIAFLLMIVPSWAWAPSMSKTARVSTKLEMSNLNRRELMGAALAGIVALQAQEAFAFSQQLDDYAVEPGQQATDGRIDVNGAFVGEYKQFPGFFPHAAGKIASNGPYTEVQDIYDIPGLTEHDVDMFKKYEDNLSVLPPGRLFNERINARVST